MHRKLEFFDLQVPRAQQEQQATRLELEPHDGPQTDESVTEQQVCVQVISSATIMQMTITNKEEKAQDNLGTVSPDKEIVNACTNNTIINAEVKFNNKNPCRKHL